MLGCLALGVGVLMIAGEFDLSVGSVYTLTAIVMAVQVSAGLNPFADAALAILIGVVIGDAAWGDHAESQPAVFHRHAWPGCCSGAARCCFTMAPCK